MDFRFFAKVDITTGMWWWKKTVTRDIARQYTGYWFFSDTGETAPMFTIENFERAANAQMDQPLDSWKP